MTPEQIQLLDRACRTAGIDPSKISPVNPFEKNGQVASLLQAAVGEIDPAQAAKWRCEAGGGLSVATLSELQSGQPLSQQAQRDLWEHDAAYVAEFQQQRLKADADALAWLDKAAAETAWSNQLHQAGGDEHEARRRMTAAEEKEKAAAVAAADSKERHERLTKRLEAQRIHDAQIAGRLAL